MILSNEKSMFLTSVTSDKIVSFIKNKKSAATDDIPISILKSCAYHIAEPLRYIIQLFYDGGIYRNKLKLGVVKPIFKKEMRKFYQIIDQLSY